VVEVRVVVVRSARNAVGEARQNGLVEGLLEGGWSMTVASTAVLLRLAPAMWEQVDAAASREGRSVGLLVADALRRALPEAAPTDPRMANLTTRTGRYVELDNDVLVQVAAVASRLGSSVDQVIEDSVGRDLAARILEPLLAESDRTSPELSEAEALELAYRELDAVRGRSDPRRR
jgi:hypothetical protein